MQQQTNLQEGSGENVEHRQRVCAGSKGYAVNEGLHLSGIRILVVGLGREGTAAAHCLAQWGARVTATDVKSAAELGEPVAQLEGLGIQFALGGHPLALLDQTDILLVSPGVPPHIPLLVEAQRRELPLSSETRLFTRLCPAPVIGITGSSGKTTTTSLVGEMLQAAGQRTWIGGNIGSPLIDHLAQIRSDDMVVMELSSFQLDYFGPWPVPATHATADDAARALFDPQGWSPPIAAILNVTPNHLDYHDTLDDYVAAKAHILAHQQPGDVAVLGRDNPITRQMAQAAGRPAQRTLQFSLQQAVPEGAFLRDEALLLRLEGTERPICSVEELRLLGRHNVLNVLAASCLAGAAGAPVQALRQVATTFRGVEHRLELVRELNGIRWYNDSIATSPERAIAALQALDAPLILLAGGRDKHLPWQEWANLVLEKVRHVVLFGEAAELIRRALREAAAPHTTGPTVHHGGTLEAAVEVAARVAHPGDVVLLAPGGTSFDAYRDYTERGEHFRSLVEAL